MYKGQVNDDARSSGGIRFGVYAAAMVGNNLPHDREA
jgi:hypothetical protein